MLSGISLIKNLGARLMICTTKASPVSSRICQGHHWYGVLSSFLPCASDIEHQSYHHHHQQGPSILEEDQKMDSGSDTSGSDTDDEVSSEEQEGEEDKSDNGTDELSKKVLSAPPSFFSALCSQTRVSRVAHAKDQQERKKLVKEMQREKRKNKVPKKVKKRKQKLAKKQGKKK